MPLPDRLARLPRLTALSLLALPGAAQRVAQSLPVPAEPRPRPTAFEEVDAGSGRVAPELHSDDAVPLPVPAVVRASDEGDVVLTPASGDPYFLAFVAGDHHPPAGERLDPLLIASVAAEPLDARPDEVTYAFAMLSKRITPERVQALEGLGCRVLGFHPHYTLKVAVPTLALDAVANLDFVRWLGAPRPWQKLHPRLVQERLAARPGEALDVYVNVFDSDLGPATTYEAVGSVASVDPGGFVQAGPEEARTRLCRSNGWQQRELERNGVEVLEYVERIRAFRARLLPEALDAVVALDFVQFVEARLPDELAHDESMPMTLMDATRADFDGSSAQVAAVGQIDSGVDTSHDALNHFFSVGWDSTSTGGAIVDDCEHGTHVAGTILGLPTPSDEGLTGAAPGLADSASRRFFNVKKFSGAGCVNGGASHATLFGHMRSDFTDVNGNVSPRPQVINCSWGSAASAGSPFVGSEADARTVDAEVWDHSQLYVFAAGNEGVSVGAQSIREEATAKNAVTVGSVVNFVDGGNDPGTLTGSSSTGPCGDGRWKPNVSAPGKWITSVDANSGSGFVNKSGTSMAAPHVTGLVAQLADHLANHKYKPHRTAAILMATAMADQDQLLTTQPGISSAHLNSFGAGRVNASNAHWQFNGVTQRTSWYSTLSSGFFAYDDFVVDPLCVRLLVLVTYHEDECSAGAAKALVNDFDLYLDSPQNGIDPAGNTGEYFAQQSSLDNTEMRTFNTPLSGTWRWKLYPTSATGSVRYSVVVQQIFDDTTPNGSLALAADALCVQPGADVEITATIDNPQYFASNLFLDSTSSGDVLQASTTTLEDGKVTDLMSNQQGGRDVVLGSLEPGDTRSATWTTRWNVEGVKTWTVEARSDNWVDETQSLQITVDGTPPSAVSNLHSTSHTVGVWSNDPTLVLKWTASSDPLSGLDGYSRVLNLGSIVAPDNVKDIGGVTSETFQPGDGGWGFSIKPVDNCGNWTAGFASAGPFRIDTAAPSAAANLASTTHTAGVQSCNEVVTVTWTASSDALSGLAGYAGIVDTNPTTDPLGPLNIADTATSHTADIGSSSSPRYVHLRPQDVAGNWGPTAHFGPLLIEADSVATYCTGKVNTLGCVPAMSWTGQPSVSAGTFTALCSNVISQKNGIMFWGKGPLSVPFQGGFVCVAPPTIRTPVLSSGGSAGGNDCTGSYAFVFDTAYMTAWSIVPGDTLHVQTWMRDPADAFGSGLSDALSATVCQ